MILHRAGILRLHHVTTTLLFAYSGGDMTLLMVFMAQDTPVDNILNYKYVAAELTHTVIGWVRFMAVGALAACPARRRFYFCYGIFT